MVKVLRSVLVSGAVALVSFLVVSRLAGGVVSCLGLLLRVCHTGGTLLNNYVLEECDLTRW